jgi:hypothetical protein
MPAGLQAAFSATAGAESRQFSAVRAHGGWIASGGGLLTHFTRTGPVIGGLSGERLALHVSAIGRGSNSGVRLGESTATATGNRVVYRRGAGVVEWYRNGPAGLEQGFALKHRPAGRDWLTLTERVPGQLSPRQTPDGVVFSSTLGGGALFRYSGLAAFDAMHRSLPVRVRASVGRILLEIDDRYATYPIVVDPIIQPGQKLTAADATKPYFGLHVALSGDGNTALIGGPESDGGVGAAWVFVRSGSTWSPGGSKMIASDEAGGGQFGSSVALSSDGSTALIGGWSDDGGQGAAWVFTRAGTTWSQSGSKLTTANEYIQGHFGGSVALSGDGSTALITAPGGDIPDSGSVFVFVRSGSTWAPQGLALVGTDGQNVPGESVALSGDGNTALIGGQTGQAPGGCAWVFTRSGVTWTQDGPILTPSNSSGFLFGSSVALSSDGTTALIGNPQDNSGVGAAWVFTPSRSGWSQVAKLSASGESGAGSVGDSVAVSSDGSTAVIGGGSDGAGAGAAWVFVGSGSKWSPQGQKLIASDEPSPDDLGYAVAISGDGNTVVAGAPGLDSDQSGAAWTFARSASAWSQQGGRLTATEEAGGGRLGVAVALSSDGSTALIGAPYDNVGVGAAWVFVRSGSTWIRQGPKLVAKDETAGGALFGGSVALSADGNTALIGGSQDGDGNGAAWVFTRSGSTWSQQGPKLLPNDDPIGGSLFGTSVALSGDGNTALIGGSSYTATYATTLSGAAWVFTRAGSTWTQPGPKLTPDDEIQGGGFGSSVALSSTGTTALVGGLDYDGGAGAAWFFTRAGSSWSQQKLTAADESGAAQFGTSVALSSDGTYAIIGGPQDNGGVGAVWAAAKSGSIWSQQGPKLTAGGENGAAAFGVSVALSGDGTFALIGGPGDAPLGAVWGFARSGSTWSQQGAKATASGETGPGGFGGSVALVGPLQAALVGAPYDDGGVGAAWVYADLSPPDPFALVAPADRAGNLSVRPSFSWDATTDTGTGIDHYELWIDGTRDQDVPPAACSGGVCTAVASSPLAGGSHAWFIMAVDRAGNTQNSATRSFSVDATAPSAPSITSPAIGSVLGTATPVLAWQAATDSGSGVDHYNLTVDGQTVTVPSSATSYVPPAPLADGGHSWSVSATDGAANQSQASGGTFTVDVAPPIAKLVVAPNPALAGTTVTLDGSGSNDPNGGHIVDYRWDLNGDGTYGTDSGASSSITHLFSRPGTYTVGLQITNGVGNTATKSATVQIDPPLNTSGDAGVQINDGNRYTNSLAVTLSIVAPPFADQIRVSNDGGSNGPLTSVPAPMFELPWQLDPSQGKETRIVYVRFYAGGRFLETQTDDIILDTTAPVIQSATIVPIAQAGVRNRHAYRLQLRAHDNRSGVAQLQVRAGATTSPFQRYRRTVLIHVRRPGAVEVRVQDGAGNHSKWRHPRFVAPR